MITAYDTIVHHKSSPVRWIIAVLLSALAALTTLSAAAHDPVSTQPVVVNSTGVTATGTVNELLVKNKLTGETLRYFGLKLDQGTSYALTGTGLDLLSNGTRINATGALAGNVFNVNLFSVVAQAPAPRTTALSQTGKTLTGTLAVYHKDFFEQGRGQYGLAVRDASDVVTQLNVAAIPDSLEIGMLVSADGRVATDGSSLDVSTITILAPAPAKLSEVAAAPVTNNVLVLPIKFTDSPAADPFSVAAILTEFQTKVMPYYQEVSYGQQLLNVTVANNSGNWLNAGAATPASCDYLTIGTLADAAATAKGYNINSYQNRYYVMPSLPCGWAGLAYVGWGRAWSNGVNALWVYGHELGHNFGLWHAGSVNCGAQVLGGSCGVSEYGDPFDVMGNIRQMHFNAMQKANLNWIPSTSVKIHTAGTQTYQLSPLESGGQSAYAIKIPTSNVKRTYWVEFRQPIGFDAPLSTLPNLGAQIRVAGPQFDYVAGSDDTEILDMTPDGNFDNAALMPGQPYIDSTTGVTISVISATPGASGLLTVSVAMGGKPPTTTTLSSSANPSLVGAGVTFTASVTGAAPTGTVAFTDGGSAISGCSAVALPAGSANAKVATCSTSGLSAATHSIIATYAGDAANNGSTSTTLSQVVSNKAPTATALSSSANPSTVGANVSFTATVNGAAPTGTVAFTDGGSAIAGCSAVALPAGSANAKVATCSTSSLSAATHNIVAAYAGDAANNGSTSTTLSQVVNNVGASINVALASNGGVASASSTYAAAGYSFAASSVNDGERAGLNWGQGGGWNDSTADSYPDWVQITFNSAKTIDHVVVYTLQDNYASPVQPTDTMTFSQYGVTAFTVQGSTGGGTWVTLGTVSGNNLVKRTINFTAASYDRIRINVTAALASYARITEIEAWGTSAGPPPQSNVALASNGGVASASSTYAAAGYSFAASSVNDGDRAGLNWGHGGGWNDSTADSYPDWVQINFNSSKTIDHVVVYTLQDNYANPVQPTDTMTFSQYGVTAFTVQGWTGSAWTTLATVSGNNLVKRTVNFNAYTTTRIRINITAALASFSRITEIEAWGN